MYGLNSMLQQFTDREGQCRVLTSHKEDGFNLSSWIANQRTNKEAMSAERHKRLDDLGFVWNTLVEDWDEGYSKLQQFKERKGHCNVLQGHKEDGFALGQWVNTQRRAKETLSAERRQRLDDIGFVWDLYAAAWEEGFGKLQQFKDREGHCKVTQRHKEDGFALGTWVGAQRTGRETLSTERRQRMDEIGFVWALRKG